MKNKLSIYLVKEEFTESKEFIVGNLKSANLSDNKILYYRPSQLRCPEWVNSFFVDDTQIQSVFQTKTASAVLSVKVEGRIVLIAFGYGRSIINLDCLEEDFGLKLALGIVKPDSLRKVSLRQIGGNQKLTQEQMPVKSSIADFDVDVYRDLVNTVTAVSINSGISDGMVSGGTGINVSADVDISNVDNYLSQLIKEYQSESYKENFGWIDNIKIIKDKQKIDALDQSLLESITKNAESVLVAIPDIIDWNNTKGFSYGTKKGQLVDDISLDGLISSFKDNLVTSVEQLKKKYIYQISSADDSVTLQRWSAYKCLFSELNYNGSHYCLNNGTWYKINNDYTKMIDEDYKSTKTSDIQFLVHSDDNKKEEVYNEAFANLNNSYINMDQKFVYHGGGGNKIEICDTLTDDKKLIHVKRGNSSSVLSHLFNQGLVSAELIKEDNSFLVKANSVIKENVKKKGLDSQNSKYEIKSSDNFTVIYGIIKKGNEKLPSIPIFSKISLYYVKRRLKAINCKVEIAHIQTNATE